MSLHYQLSVSQAQKALPARSGQKSPGWETMDRWFGETIRAILKQIQDFELLEVEEIRLRVGQPFMLRTSGKDLFFNSEGKITSPSNAYCITQEDLTATLDKMTQSSVYAVEEDLKQGFLTLPGGNRVGVTGEAILQKGEVQKLKHISSLNVRLARDYQGHSLRVLPKICRKDGTLYHTLVISAPRAGKTTLLRDLIRLISNGVPQMGLEGQSVGVIDERGELAGMNKGLPSYNLGCRTDVLDGCPKVYGMTMLIRSMAPQVVVMDELGHHDEIEALKDALRTGVRILCTAHASSLEEAKTRPTLSYLLEDGVFERLVVLSRQTGPGTIEGVYDLKTGRSL
ncbi:stage III sporulation protein AA [Desulfosporosinus acidiphilus SJ4]|uniref:Stage III sporulation protein AA n=1 Tax=Desulfosporosinus acidiphilus (strain DSM 22704 / JCM 16185 / SJ4) TaxID=646529 RepID=I4D8X6_DESAJ|nr:stage III sporulation protein AA [Desulfosporosinus acidiphilus]AFM42250.1 stage III sporulation protein AA [Desulfosporosinus acidiphilus SJ4]